MIRLKFNGWFQCRLATDPDPADEPRGVSGYMKALAGEPDLDRIIRLQSPPFQRTHTPPVGVFVREVFRDNVPEESHALVGGAVNLLDNPIFKGENGVVAEDGKEPIVPFILEIKKDALKIVRSCPPTPEFTEFPYSSLQSSGIVIAPGLIADATGISNIRQSLTRRIAKLEEDHKNETDEGLRDNIERRIAFLKTPNAFRFFGALMNYFVPLAGKGSVSDPDKQLTKELDFEKPWTIDFWFGGWDSDAASGFMQGYLNIQEK